MKRLLSYFLQGLVFLVPIGLTIWVLLGAIVTIDEWGRGRFGLDVPGFGIAFTITAITFAGFLASNFLTRRLMRALETLFDRLPLVKMLHGALKDLLSAFVGEKKRFDKPVIVTLNAEKTLKALGFITREDVSNLGEPGSVAVYFPQSYNFAGQVVLVAREVIRPVAQSSGDLMAFIVSGGITGK
ncbi:MAG: DUF502 domain-containing protein [Deltaproteobacteria bacterium]|nr:DUF502 domain-containing protein [Deltaproteobacteria bacterium]